MELMQLDRVQMGGRIRQCREQLELTREAFAEKLGVSSKFIADIECGAKGISLKKLCILVQVLGVSADYLLLGDTRRRRLVCEVKYYVE